MVTLLKILGGILAFLYGIHLGLGKGFEPDRDEIEKALGEKGTRRKVRRHFTFLDLFLARTREKGSDARRRSQKRKPFELNR